MKAPTIFDHKNEADHRNAWREFEVWRENCRHEARIQYIMSQCEYDEESDRYVHDPAHEVELDLAERRLADELGAIDLDLG